MQLPLLMAKSRHRSLRTLQRYARPGPDAVAALTAAHDPPAAAEAASQLRIRPTSGRLPPDSVPLFLTGLDGERGERRRDL